MRKKKVVFVAPNDDSFINDDQMAILNKAINEMYSTPKESNLTIADLKKSSDTIVDSSVLRKKHERLLSLLENIASCKEFNPEYSARDLRYKEVFDVLFDHLEETRMELLEIGERLDPIVFENSYYDFMMSTYKIMLTYEAPMERLAKVENEIARLKKEMYTHRAVAEEIIAKDVRHKDFKKTQNVMLFIGERVGKLMTEINNFMEERNQLLSVIPKN